MAPFIAGVSPSWARHAERFAAPLYYWDESDYEEQWRQGVERLVGGADTSCLVTWMHDPVDDRLASGGSCTG
jgi:CdiI N-terminal domain